MDTTSKNILVIDDDITSLDIISFVFEERGYNVSRCADGRSAIEYVKSTKPDLLIVDLMMPGINGTETIKEIRALGLTDVPIIAFTAIDDPLVHQEVIDAGCNKVLTKPCRPEKLIQHIESFMNET